MLLELWQRAKMLGDLPTARELLARLEQLAKRPRPDPTRGVPPGEGDRDDADEMISGR